jgi:chloramphenicol 3-O-phosphotransferase
VLSRLLNAADRLNGAADVPRRAVHARDGHDLVVDADAEVAR